jgi:hypothetical protein
VGNLRSNSDLPTTVCFENHSGVENESSMITINMLETLCVILGEENCVFQDWGLKEATTCGMLHVAWVQSRLKGEL